MNTRAQRHVFSSFYRLRSVAMSVDCHDKADSSNHHTSCQTRSQLPEKAHVAITLQHTLHALSIHPPLANDRFSPYFTLPNAHTERKVPSAIASRVTLRPGISKIFSTYEGEAEGVPTSSYVSPEKERKKKKTFKAVLYFRPSPRSCERFLHTV